MIIRNLYTCICIYLPGCEGGDYLRNKTKHPSKMLSLGLLYVIWTSFLTTNAIMVVQDGRPYPFGKARNEKY